MQELTHHIISSKDQHQHLQKGKLWLLEKFAIEWPILQISGILLPDLVEFYQWLNTNVSHILTREEASSITIGDVIRLAEENSSKDVGLHVRELFERVKKNYNTYLELTDRVLDGGIYDNRTPLLRLLTG